MYDFEADVLDEDEEEAEASGISSVGVGPVDHRQH
jgi:hypothetical protein